VTELKLPLARLILYACNYLDFNIYVSCDKKIKAITKARNLKNTIILKTFAADCEECSAMRQCFAATIRNSVYFGISGLGLFRDFVLKDLFLYRFIQVGHLAAISL
jgi:hypothetical protein